MKIWGKIKRPLCGVIMLICLLLLLGCTAGTAEGEGNLATYTANGTILLIICIAAGIAGDFIG